MAINWFEVIDQKDKRKFVQFDIWDFYPSISENLLRRTIILAQFVEVSNEEIRIIIYELI